jgi:superfamily I DNA/RNA helicase
MIQQNNIQTKRSSFTPTQEQQDTINKAVSMSPAETLFITAFAGAAKTSTLVMIAEAVATSKMLYLAFNKAIVNEAQKRFPSNVEVRTTHSLAFRFTTKGKKVRVSNYRAAEIASELDIEYEKAVQVLSLFDHYCNSALPSISKIAADEEILKLVETIYDRMQSGAMEITHSWYLKEFQLLLVSGAIKISGYHYCLLDEAQDVNPVTLSIFTHLPGRRIAVGDKHQKIYGFRGAIDAMVGEEKVKSTPGTSIMRLTTTFRCQQHIVDHANWILGTFKGEKTQIISANNSHPTKDSMAVITRTNSALIEYIDDIDEFNLTRTPELLFDCLLSLLNWKYGRHGEISKAFKFLTFFSNMAEINAYVEQSNDQELAHGLKLLEKYDNAEWANRGFRAGAKIRKLYEKARIQYNQNGLAKVTLTTAHSCKGLEFDTAILGSDFPNLGEIVAKLRKDKVITSPDDFLLSKKQEVVAAREECNLYYVAVTRAKYELQDRTPTFGLYADHMTIDDIFSQISV